MRKKFLPVLAMVIALVMLVAIAAPIFAHNAPLNANANDLNIGIFRIAKTYHLGDVINYEITVYVPLTDPNPSSLPCLQTSMSTYFTDPHDVTGLPNPVGPQTHTLDFPTIPQLLPGESVVFTNGLTTSTIYDPQGGDPTRAQLVAGTAAMPANPTFTTSTTIFPGGTAIPGSSYPKLDYTIISADLSSNPNLIAFAHTENTAGAHDNPDNNDNGAKETTISTFTSAPGTTVHITSSASSVNLGDNATLTVTEHNTGNVALTSPYVIVLKNSVFFDNLTAPPTSGDAGTIGRLDVGETWTWSVNSGPLTAAATFQATGHGMDNSVPPVDITVGNFPTEQDSVTIGVNQPGTSTSVSASLTPTVFGPGGGTADLTFTESNTGQIPLNNVSVTVLKDGVPFGSLLIAPPTSGDAAPLGVLDPGETWTWIVTGVPIITTTTFTAVGYGDYSSNPVIPVTFPDFPLEQSSLVITVPPLRQLPASSDLGLGLLILGFAGMIGFLAYRKVRRTQA